MTDAFKSFGAFAPMFDDAVAISAPRPFGEIRGTFAACVFPADFEPPVSDSDAGSTRKRFAVLISRANSLARPNSANSLARPNSSHSLARPNSSNSWARPNSSSSWAQPHRGLGWCFSSHPQIGDRVTLPCGTVAAVTSVQISVDDYYTLEVREI